MTNDKVMDRLPEILDEIERKGGIDPLDIHKIFGGEDGYCNCYPGIPGHKCCDIAYFVAFEPGTHSLAKNIVVYKGIAEEKTFGNPDDIYSTEIEIEPTKELVRRWYYSPQYQKYYVKNDEL